MFTRRGLDYGWWLRSGLLRVLHVGYVRYVAVLIHSSRPAATHLGSRDCLKSRGRKGSGWVAVRYGR